MSMQALEWETCGTIMAHATGLCTAIKNPNLAGGARKRIRGRVVLDQLHVQINLLISGLPSAIGSLGPFGTSTTSGGRTSSRL